MRPDQDYSQDAGASLSDVAHETLDFQDGFSIRFAEGPRTEMHWQAGKIVMEGRNYRAPGMTGVFQRSVTLFWLKGIGSTRDAALAMAQRKSGRNGR